MSRPTPRPWLPIASAIALALAMATLLLRDMFKEPLSSPPSAGKQPVATGPSTLSALAPEPVWDDLGRYADGLTPEDFRAAMDRVYGDGTASWTELLAVTEAPAGPHIEIVRRSAEPASPRLILALNGTRSAPRYWREAGEMPPAEDPANRPLGGVRIALDPGHIGGAWARMEQRWYQPLDEPTQVMEGEMTLVTARVLKSSLEALGATVTLVREATDPVTATRPEDYASLVNSPQQAELYFYRKAEIRARADKVNSLIQPDLVVCLHFNAEPWGEPGKVTFTEINHLHLIVNGHYSRDELALDDVRFEMLHRVFQRSEREELRLADAVSKALAAATGLPPYNYEAGHMAGNAHRPLPENPYVWARNLMANRLYQCPVVFTEPYVMNNREVFDRVAAGDYPGEKLVAGALRKSLYREYADAVAAGLRAHFAAFRPAATSSK